MKQQRLLALMLSLAMAAAMCVPALAAEDGAEWLIPKLREYGGFTDVAGTIAEDAAATCCQAGLMDGVDSRHFYPTNGLSTAQIIVISARLLERLNGGDLSYFEPISKTGSDWWTPYDAYLTERIPALAENTWYQWMETAPTYNCYREEFFRLLAAVLDAAGASLPEINEVYAVPDCNDQILMQFYRWGVLAGKDQYGSLIGRASLSQGAAAAMLARLIDPAQRLTRAPERLELCQALLGIDPETVLMTVDGQDITAEVFMPILVQLSSHYNHAHFASMTLEESGRTTLDEALDALRELVLCETLAAESGLDVTPSNTVYYEGYQGLTSTGQAWISDHDRLYSAVLKALDGPLPAERLPEIAYAPVWETLDFSDFDYAVRDLPYWGGQF